MAIDFGLCDGIGNVIGKIHSWFVTRLRKRALLRQLLIETMHNIAVLEIAERHYELAHKKDTSSPEARAFLWRVPRLLKVECLEKFLGAGPVEVLVNHDLKGALEDQGAPLVHDNGEGLAVKIYLRIAEAQTLSNLSVAEDPMHIRIGVRLGNLRKVLKDARDQLEAELKWGRFREVQRP
jgi:hypothetical protein